MLVFLDTEFSDFTRPDLISLALVAEDGREFYAERTDYTATRCTEFVRETVLPLLGRVPGAMTAPTRNSLSACAHGSKNCRSPQSSSMTSPLCIQRGIPLAPQESDFGFSPLFHHLFVGDRLCHNSLLKQTIKQ
jgi:hypothetical protein